MVLNIKECFVVNTDSHFYRLLLVCSLALFLASCQWMAQREINQMHGKPTTVPRFSTVTKNATQEATPRPLASNFLDVDVYQQSREILNKRCVVCHACYDAPCQLKLTSIEGLDRGASSELVYDLRLLSIERSRLFEDGITTQDWRDKGFYPVLNERQQNPSNNLDLSLVYQLLKQKNQYPLPPQALLPEAIDVGIHRKAFCPKVEEYSRFKKDHELLGMPFGLPAITQNEFSTLEKWLATGAMAPKPKPMANGLQKSIERWERLFNQREVKSQLINRYIYEHLYLAHLYFVDAGADTQFFRMVRSSTPPGTPIRVIPTSRPYDSPYKKSIKEADDGNDRFYYRLRPMVSTIVSKTHQPYLLDDERYSFWQDIFYQKVFTVNALPSYDTEVSSNPFKSFVDIPTRSRYKFLLKEAQYSIMNFIKGPVCRGQVALDVIHDNFWIVFVDPDSAYLDSQDQFLRENSDLLKFPAFYAKSANVFSWYKLATLSKEYMQAKTQYINALIKEGDTVGLDLIWDGDQGENKNAALTIFRNFDSATVLKGFAGTEPKTSWLIGYDLLERIHYLLVAGFEVNGNITHQLVTRLYMEFLRMEGEAAFISLLPKDKQLAVKNRWYINPGNDVNTYFDILLDHSIQGTAIPYKGDDVQSELYNMLTVHVGADRYRLLEANYPGLTGDQLGMLQKINTLIGMNVSLLSQSTVLNIETQYQGETKNYWFSLVHHNAHKNLTHLLSEEKTRMPEYDQLNILPGFISSYPNTYLKISAEQIPSLLASIKSLKDESDYKQFMTDFGLRRTNKDFWAFSDTAHAAYKKSAGLTYGVLDYNRLENR